MITFLDEKDIEHGALATIKVTNAVNGERSLTGEIESGDYVLANIERGWRLRFEDEFYVVTYAKPVDDGKTTHVTFDAVHQFFWDFDKSSVHEQLNDGSHTVLNYLDFIFADSGYTYTIDPLLKVYAFEKQSFGYKSRLKLFNDVITSSGVEFQVNGKVVRILEKTGTDLSTVVRKNFNMNELGIEKHIGDFVTYQKGFGAWVDENDHTKGRLVTEYTSPLASVYGKLEAEPLVDERYTQADNMIAALKANIDNSYSISVRLDMEDLTRAGYEYTQPRAGDYIMAINETLDFQEKIRIVSFTSEYDVTGQLIKHEVTCNDIGAVKKLSASYNLTKEQAQNASDSVGKAVEMANKALVSADGKSTVYFGNEFPKDEPKGTLHKGDSLYLTVGDTTKMYYWTGADWEELPIVNDVEAFKEQIADELKDVPNREEFEATITEKLATSKAEIKTQIDTAKTQAESNAKAYADEINQATAGVAEQANTAVNSLKSDLAKVKTDLTTTTSTANAAKTSASEAKQQLTTVANDLSKAKTDLQNAVSAVDTKATNLQSDVSNLNTSLSNTAKALQTQGTTLANQAKELQTQASQLTDQAKAQETLTTRVENVETTANGTKTTVSELSKTVTQNGKDITSVSNRTKTVEISLTSAKTSISELQTSVSTAQTDLTNLTKRTKTVEDGLTGTKTNLSELTQTVSSDGERITSLTSRTKTVEDSVSGLKTTMSSVQKDLTSTTARTKTVEDDLSGTKTTLSQVQSTAETASKKTATLETGLNGLSAKFDNLTVGNKNYLPASRVVNRGCSNFKYNESSKSWTMTVPAGATGFGKGITFNTDGLNILLNGGETLFFGLMIKANKTCSFNYDINNYLSGSQSNDNDDRSKQAWSPSNKSIPANVWTRVWFSYTAKANVPITEVNSNFGIVNNTEAVTVEIKEVMVAKSNVPVDYQMPDAELEQKVADYKQTADQNYASLQTTVQNLDGTVQQNKTTAEQTAAGFKTRIESLETYKDGENTRANQYFESAKTETARQLTAERTAIAKDYVAKSTYTSDVTGIRNDLTATTTTANTTKTNLANYQASNDKAVANLQSNLQTANGNISSLQTKVEAVPGQITSAVSAVEGKIPTNLDSLNLMTGTRDWSTKANTWHMGANWLTESEEYQGLKVHSTQKGYNGSHQNIFVKNGDVITFSFFAKATNTLSKIKVSSRWSDSSVYQAPLAGVKENDEQITITSEWKRYSKTVHITSDGSLQFRTEYDGSTIPNGNTFYVAGLKLAKSSQDTGYSENPTDAASDITKLNTTLTQTADGLKQLSTQVTSQGNTITSHTNSINSLTTGLSAKVSQTDFNTLSGRVTTAENNLTATANQLSSKITSVEGKIPTSASQRNLIQGTSVSWSPFVDITTKTNWTYDLATVRYGDETGIYAGTTINIFVYLSADEIVPDSSINPRCFIQGAVINKNGAETWTNWDKYHPFHNKWSTNLVAGNNYKIVKLSAKVSSESYSNINGFNIEVRIDGVKSGKFHHRALMVTTGDVFPDYWSPALEDYDSKLATAQSEIKQTTDAITASVSSVQTAASNAQATANTAVSKADAAQAGVNTLDSTTVKSASLTINTDGIVMKAGKSTTDVANAIGSYFAVNQNAINLFSDKINVKGSMIVDGAITSNKIASKSINTAHLNGKIITADVISTGAITADAIKTGAVTTDKMTANSINGDRITAGTLDAAKIKAGSITASQIASETITSSQIKSGTISAANIATGTITGDNIKANSVDVSKISGLSAEYLKAKIENAMIDWMKGKTITAYNGNMAIDLQNGRISFKDGSNAVYRQTDDGIHTGFLHFEAGSQGGIYAAFGATSTRQGINSKSSEFAGIRCYRVSAYGDSHDAKIDKIEVIGDAIQFGHGYRSDGQIGGGFIMDTAVFGNDTPYSLNRVIKSIEALWRILHDHAKNTGYRFNDSAFIGALNNEYNAWHDMHNI